MVPGDVSKGPWGIPAKKDFKLCGHLIIAHCISMLSWPFRPSAIEQKCPIFTGTIFATSWCSVDGEWTVSTVLALSGGVAWPRPQTGHRHRHINIPMWDIVWLCETCETCETLWHCETLWLWQMQTPDNQRSAYLSGHTLCAHKSRLQSRSQQQRGWSREARHGSGFQVHPMPNKEYLNMILKLNGL